MAASMTDGIFLARPERPADGIPLAVKDLFDTAGLTTTYGSVLFAEHMPGETAEVVRLLEAAGYINVGKTNLHEFAYGVTSENSHFGTVPNPLRKGRVAGGSSGGSAAALAAGLADAALRTDLGGSIRIPAPRFDHAGPMARTVGECTQMMKVLASGFQETGIEALEEIQIGVAWLDEADPLVHARVGEAAERFPRRRLLAFPRPDDVDPIFMGEVADVHRELYEENRELYGVDVARKIERCLAVTDREREAAARRRERYREQALEALGDLDLLLLPTTPIVAPEARDAEDDERRERLIHFTFPINALGWPALALPCGPAEDGLPASLQLVGRPGDDALVLAVGKRLEQELDGAVRRGESVAFYENTYPS